MPAPSKCMEFVELDEEAALNEVRDLSNDEFSAFLYRLPKTDILLFNTLLTLQRNLYWKAQDLDKILVLTREMIIFVKEHPDGTPWHQSAAYYNLASFTCPWWSDSLDIPEELALAGFEAAKKLVWIREKYQFETIKIAGGYWIFGCQYLYNQHDYENAIHFFNRAEELARTVPEDKLSYLVVGNSIEGKGKAQLILKGRKEGIGLISEAIRIYVANEDDYSKGEAETFLDQYSP